MSPGILFSFRPWRVSSCVPQCCGAWLWAGGWTHLEGAAFLWLVQEGGQAWEWRCLGRRGAAPCAVEGCGFLTLAPRGQLHPAWALRNCVAPEEWLCPQATVPGALGQVVAEAPCVWAAASERAVARQAQTPAGPSRSGSPAPSCKVGDQFTLPHVSLGQPLLSQTRFSTFVHWIKGRYTHWR